ncbi:MAG TPA: hypothetical protein VJP45_03215 [Candidatus Limnocylindria bacterium]|nr:hypothetical protein [Candidatus Limnocylindria bacterium]
MDIILSWAIAAVVFAVVSVLFGQDSRDPRRACEVHGSWVGLTA